MRQKKQKSELIAYCMNETEETKIRVSEKPVAIRGVGSAEVEARVEERGE